MDCGRCGEGTLTAYALGDSRATVCEACGFVGIPADHRGDVPPRESWEDALTRFESAGDPDRRPSEVVVAEAPSVPVERDASPPTLDDVGTVSVGIGLDGRDAESGESRRDGDTPNDLDGDAAAGDDDRNDDEAADDDG